MRTTATQRPYHHECFLADIGCRSNAGQSTLEAITVVVKG